MTPSIARLLQRIGLGGGGMACVAATREPTPPPPPYGRGPKPRTQMVVEPKVSCLALGIVKSIEAGEWREVCSIQQPGAARSGRTVRQTIHVVRHTPTEMTISVAITEGTTWGAAITSSSFNLSAADEVAILAAFNAHPFQSLARMRSEVDRQAANLRAFSDCGCPTESP